MQLRQIVVHLYLKYGNILLISCHSEPFALKHNPMSSHCFVHIDATRTMNMTGIYLFLYHQMVCKWLRDLYRMLLLPSMVKEVHVRQSCRENHHLDSFAMKGTFDFITRNFCDGWLRWARWSRMQCYRSYVNPTCNRFLYHSLFSHLQKSLWRSNCHSSKCSGATQPHTFSFRRGTGYKIYTVRFSPRIKVFAEWNLHKLNEHHHQKERKKTREKRKIKEVR